MFLAGALLSVGWIVVALAAWRRAGRRRALIGQAAEDRGAALVLVVAPFIVLAATVYWVVAGDGASAAARTATYAAAWWEDRPSVATDDFTTPIDPISLEAAWARQDARLHDLLVATAAEAGPTSGIDPDRPWESVRFTEGPGLTSDPLVRTVRLELVRRDVVRQTALGFLPATALELVPVADLGTIELRLDRAPPPLPGLPVVEAWRIVRVDALGEVIGA